MVRVRNLREFVVHQYLPWVTRLAFQRILPEVVAAAKVLTYNAFNARMQGRRPDGAPGMWGCVVDKTTSRAFRADEVPACRKQALKAVVGFMQGSYVPPRNLVDKLDRTVLDKKWWAAVAPEAVDWQPAFDDMVSRHWQWPHYI